ncbi:MAG: type II toxin-antitoxin system VapC family toxin [Chloroflexia bacterium]|nr:type II toxin-antitoxin system VapC family toxin [Chloroflexia bacterium]
MICVDSSVVVKQIIDEDHSPQTQALFAMATRQRVVMVAPQLLMMEVGNVLLKKTRRPSVITPREALASFRDALDLGILLEDPESLHDNALRIAVSFQLPAIYDAYYLALAADAKCDFWTAGPRLMRALAGRVPSVRWIGDFRA